MSTNNVDRYLFLFFKLFSVNRTIIWNLSEFAVTLFKITFSVHYKTFLLLLFGVAVQPFACWSVVMSWKGQATRATAVNIFCCNSTAQELQNVSSSAILYIHICIYNTIPKICFNFFLFFSPSYGLSVASPSFKTSPVCVELESTMAQCTVLHVVMIRYFCNHASSEGVLYSSAEHLG